jgi:hypothetical protein
MSDATYNLNGSFKPTMKRFADLDGPDFFPTPRWATFALIENEKVKGEIWGVRVRRRYHVTCSGRNRPTRSQF